MAVESLLDAPSHTDRSTRWPQARDLLSARRVTPLLQHCLLAWPLALLPSLAFIGLAYGLAWSLDIDMALVERVPERTASFKDFFGMVVFAPLVETLLLSALLALLTRLSRRPLFVAGASAVLWGCLHGAYALLWFFGTFWSFYVFSCSYLAWRPRGWWRAYVAGALPHALVNLTVFAVLLLD